MPLAADTPVSKVRPVSSGSNAYSDRFIPSRLGSGDILSAFELLGHQNSDPNLPPASSPDTCSNPSSDSPSARNSYSALLRSELLDAQTFDLSSPPSFSSSSTSSPSNCQSDASTPTITYQRPASLKLETTPILHLPTSAVRSSLPARRSGTKTNNIFRFHDNHNHNHRPHSASYSACDGGGYVNSALRNSTGISISLRSLANTNSQPTARIMAELGAGSRGLRSGGGAARKISRIPFKVLDAPCLKDDFYLNLVDWSSRNVLAVGLGCCVYLWSAHTSVVTKLCELKFGGPICSVSWSLNGTELAIGTAAGLVQLWDTTACKLIRTMTGHTARVGCLTWNTSLLSSGGRDSHIFNRDLRTRESYVQKWSAHKHEVCGLKWSPDDAQLASGGNDNKLLIWNLHGSSGSNSDTNTPRITYNQHSAAVKAIAWSPHSRGILASGGGTQDKKIRFWNTAKSGIGTDDAGIVHAPISQVDTGSQVCNLAWSKNVNEIVSTHGYSQNQIVVWKYPSLSKVATLTGHALRVLYLAVSPSGESIVTGAGDETLRFWNVFPGNRGKRNGVDEEVSKLSSARMHIR